MIVARLCPAGSVPMERIAWYAQLKTSAEAAFSSLTGESKDGTEGECAAAADDLGVTTPLAGSSGPSAGSILDIDF
jgi:hypothetical protein